MSAGYKNLPHFRIDSRDWMKGNNLYDDYPTGGLLSLETGYNPWKYPGLLVGNQAWSSSAVTASLKQVPAIAVAGTPSGTTQPYSLIVCSMNSDPNTVGKAFFYEVNPDTGVQTVIYNVASSKNYKLGVTEAENWASSSIFTSEDNLTRILPFSTGIGAVSEGQMVTLGGSALNTNTPHPMALFESDFVYIGDGDNLVQFELPASTAVNNYFTSIPDAYGVTSLVEHRGYLLIAISKWVGFSPPANAKFPSSILVWDGFSPSFVDQYPIDDYVTAMVVSDEGTCFIWTKKEFGYLNGSVFVPLRAVTTPVYKHQVVKVPGGIMYADGINLIRFSSAFPGGKKYFFIEDRVTQTITAIGQMSANTPIIFTDGGTGHSGSNLLYPTLDTGTSNANALGLRTHEFNPRLLTKSVKVRYIVIETAGLGGGAVIVQYKDSEGTLIDCKAVFDAAVSTMTNKRRWVFEVFSTPGTSVISPVLTLKGAAKLKSIDFYYEEVEDTGNA